MKSHISKIAALAILTSSAYATSFTSIGQLSTSIGGAGVAVKNSPYSIYYNPALLGVGEKSGIGMSGGVNYTENNLSDNIQTLSDLNIDGIDKQVTVTNNGKLAVTPKNNDNLIKLQDSIKSLAAGNSLSVGPAIAITAEFGNYGIGIISQGSANATAQFDGDRTEFIFEDNGIYAKYDPNTKAITVSNVTEYNAKSIEYAVKNNLTRIKINGLILTEVPLGYGTKIEVEEANLYLGATLKFMSGKTYNASAGLEDENFDDKLEDSGVSSSTFGIDVGVYAEPDAVEGLGLGLVAKNINSPKFKVTNASDLKVEPQIRAGLSYDIYDNLTFAMDYDISKNDIYINDIQTQYFGGGINFHPGDSFSLRGGIMQDLENDDLGSIFTAGLSVGLFGATIDLGAQMSSEKAKNSDGDELPRYAQANIGLNFVW